MRSTTNMTIMNKKLNKKFKKRRLRTISRIQIKAKRYQKVKVKKKILMNQLIIETRKGSLSQTTINIIRNKLIQ